MIWLWPRPEIKTKNSRALYAGSRYNSVTSKHVEGEDWICLRDIISPLALVRVIIVTWLVLCMFLLEINNRVYSFRQALETSFSLISAGRVSRHPMLNPKFGFLSYFISEYNS
jgi:hypothetical protein